LNTSWRRKVEKEVKGFTNIRGYSGVLGTSNPLLKLLWILFFLLLFSAFIQNVYENIYDFFQYTVVTEIKTVNEYPMTFPAITLCLVSLPTFSTDLDPVKSLLYYKFNGIPSKFEDIESFEIRTQFNMLYNSENMTCFVFNGGRNSSGHSIDIKTTKQTGLISGFSFMFYLPKDHFLIYYVNEAKVRPASTELESNRYILPGSLSYFRLEKSVETKSDYPYSRCKKPEDFPDSAYIRKLSELNITYRQVNCFELCKQAKFREYALEKKINEKDAWNYFKEFDYMEHCENLCPLECTSTTFSTHGVELSTQMFTSTFTSIEFYDKMRNSTETNETDDEINQRILGVDFFYEDLKFYQITQTPKTNWYGLISNIGGSSGVFLELSFLSACKTIEFMLGIILKF